MKSYKSLRPNVRTMGLLGGTGDGKTLFSVVPASKKAFELLNRCVGSTNSTIHERLLVYTTETTEKMVVAVRLNERPISRVQYTEIFTSAMARVIRDTGNNATPEETKVVASFRNELLEGVQKKANTKAIFSLLEEKELDSLVEDMTALYKEFELWKYNYVIYNAAKNGLSGAESKKNSAKFLNALLQEVERTLDALDSEAGPTGFKPRFWALWESLNSRLRESFFTYFGEDERSEDGYYYRELDLDDPDEEFVAAMFTNNDTQGGGRLSLEVLCSELVLYVPMNEKIADMIREEPTAREIFQDSKGNTVFGLLDTRGLYHTSHTDAENSEYCSDLLYRRNADAIIMMLPMYGDSNEKKARELYQEVFQNFRRQIPIFVVHNKLDLFVNSLEGEAVGNPLFMDDSDAGELSEAEVKSRIKKQAEGQERELRAIRQKDGKAPDFRQVVCYLKCGRSFPEYLKKEYSVLEAYQSILCGTAQMLEKDASKIRFNAGDGEDVVLTLTDRFRELLHTYVQSADAEKAVFKPGELNRSANINLTPHGNSYLALKRRLRRGDGYESNIDESYYYNCQQIHINFPANIRNFPSAVFLHEVVTEALCVEGGQFLEAEDQERFRKKVEGKLLENDAAGRWLVQALLYEDAIQKAEEESIGFSAWFRHFLERSMDFLVPAKLDEEKYAEKLKEIIIDAANAVIDLDVKFV